MEAGIGAGSVGPVVGSEFHVVAELSHSLWAIVDVSATVVGHDVSVPTSASGWIVDGVPFSPEESTMVVLVDHHLILLHHANRTNKFNLNE